jgi:hypothetical protein
MPQKRFPLIDTRVRERGRVVAPSSTIATTRPSCCKVPNNVRLVGGEHLGDHLVDPDLRLPRAVGFVC